MRLDKIRIRHFRSLYDCALPLKSLNLFIGPNGSGKSNLFKALRFLHVAVAGDAKEWESYDALIDDLLWYGLDPGKKRPRDLEFWMYGSADCSTSTEYLVHLKATKMLRVAQEILQLKDIKSGKIEPFFTRKGEVIDLPASWPVQSVDNVSTTKARSAQVLTLRDWGPGFEQLPFKSFYQHIAGWRFFDANPKLARVGHFIPPEPEEVPPLASDASNLSAFLYALDRRQRDDFEAVAEAIRRSIELPESLIVEHDRGRGGSQARYRFTEAIFGDRLLPPESMSDGTIRLLAYMSLLLADRSAPLACLEEPDSGLHPRLMLHLADALRNAIRIEATGGNTRQMLITTHSPELMDCFDLAAESEYLQVFVVERDDRGRTSFTPVTADEFSPWLEKYRLGEAVRRRFV